MRDYKPFLGQRVTVITDKGDTFYGTLVAVGRDTLTLGPAVDEKGNMRQGVEYYPGDVDTEKLIAGRVIIDRLALHFVQVGV